MPRQLTRRERMKGIAAVGSVAWETASALVELEPGSVPAEVAAEMVALVEAARLTVAKCEAEIRFLEESADWEGGDA